MRSCLREPIETIFEAANLLNLAVEAHLGSQPSEAEALIRKADIPAIADWTESVWGKATPEIHWRIEQEEPLPYLGKADRPTPDSDTERQIVERDGYHCRFCGIPVIQVEVRRKLVKIYPLATRWAAGTQNSMLRSSACGFNLITLSQTNAVARVLLKTSSSLVRPATLGGRKIPLKKWVDAPLGAPRLSPLGRLRRVGWSG